MLYICRLGLGKFVGEGFISNDEESSSESDSSDSDNRDMFKTRKRRVSSPTDYKNKMDEAEDFFDINELADESKDDYDDLETAIPVSKVPIEVSEKHKNGADFKNGDDSDDKQLMPPPPPHSGSSNKQDEFDDLKSKSRKPSQI